MKLEFPVLAKSDDRSSRAKTNPYCGEPESWFATEHFRSNGLRYTSFDFFINWSNNTFQPIAWVKRIISGARSTDPQDILAAITACDGKEYFEDTKNFCRANGVTLEYILIPDIPVNAWVDLNNKVIVFDPDSLAVSELSVVELIDRIHRIKVKYFRVGGKGLMYSTSSLEAFLSMRNDAIRYAGDAIFPGDADVILFDSDYRPKILIELKKYNTGTYNKYHIKIEDETISRYRSDDKLKYESLDIFQRHFGCEFYMLFYPVTNDKVIKLEKIQQLTPRASAVLPLPDIRSDKSLQDFRTGFFRFVNAGNT